MPALIKRLIAASFFLVTASAPSAARAQDSGPPPAAALWTISSDDCVGVHADGEPWRECGIQAFAMNGDASRVLTVSAGGMIQLWDGDGREMKRLDWPDDQQTGASGYPGGRALIAGNLGVAVTHYNQLALIDLADGRILSQTLEDVMVIDELRFIGPDRLFARVKDKEWHLGVREIVLPSGEMRAVPGTDGWTTLDSFGPRIWVTGAKAPFAVVPARPGGAAPEGARGCVPVEGRFCFWRDYPGRYVHMLDLRGGGRSLDTGWMLGPYESVEFAAAGERQYAVVCRQSPVPYPPRRPCSILDLADGRQIYAFETNSFHAIGAVDEQGRSEVRLALSSSTGGQEDRRVAADGTMRVIDAAGRANLAAPGGGMIVPGETEATSILVDGNGRPVARLPFPAQRCGNGWPSWSGYCRISADGRRWLVPSNALAVGPDSKVQLILYDVAPGGR